MRYNIETADNGWIISWWDEDGEESVQHSKVFEIPEDFDTMREDPQTLIDLLYFIKEEVCGQYYSKHKSKNVMVRFEDGTE